MSKHIPNIITTVRIILLPFMFFFFITDLVPNSKLYALLIFIFAAGTDFLDGYLARKNNWVTDLGKLLDPIADKMLFYSGIFLIIIGTNILPMWASSIIIFINLIRDFAVDCLRMIATTKNIVIAANWFGKIKTAISFVAIPWLMFLALETSYLNYEFMDVIGYALISLSTLFCLLSGIIYFIQNRKVFSL